MDSTRPSLFVVGRLGVSLQKLVPWGLLLFNLLLLLLVLKSGVVLCSDTNFYSERADELIASGFNYFQTLRNGGPAAQTHFRLAFITVVAVLKLLFSERWAHGLVAINLLCTAFTSWLLLRQFKSWRLSVWGTATFCAFFFLCYDWILWQRYVLSDVIFATLCYGTLCLFPWALFRKGANFGTLLLMLGLCLPALLFRPNAAPLPMAAVSLWIWHRFESRSIYSNRARAILFFAMATAAVVAIAAVLTPYVTSDEVFPIPVLRGLFPIFKEGNVVDQRFYTYHTRPTDMLGVLWLLVDRMLMFFSPITRDFSFAHKLLNLLFFTPLFGGIGLAFRALLKEKARSDPFGKMASVCIFYIICAAVFHSLTLIDYDWRYRFSVMLPMIALATYGFEKHLFDGARLSIRKP